MIRTRNLLTTLVLLGGLGLSLLATPAARAGLIPNQVTVTPTSGGNYTWSYNVVVTSDVYVQPGDYFTIYDFAGAVPGSITAPAGWTLSTQMSAPRRRRQTRPTTRTFRITPGPTPARPRFSGRRCSARSR